MSILASSNQPITPSMHIQFQLPVNTRYIYIATDGTYDLKRYDFYRNTYQNIPLKDSLPRPFSFTSILVLPHYDIFFTGMISSPYSYILQHRTYKLIKLPNIPTPRFGVALYYYNSQIYAFGGINMTPLSISNTLYLNSNIWKAVPSLSVARFNASCEGIGSKIYIIGGTSSNIIEEFDTVRYRYRVLEVTTDIYWGIPVVKDDRLYILKEKTCIICVSSSLAYYTKRQVGWKGNMFSRSNKLYVNGGVVYHNAFNGRIEMYSFSQGDKVELLHLL